MGGRRLSPTSALCRTPRPEAGLLSCCVSPDNLGASLEAPLLFWLSGRALEAMADGAEQHHDAGKAHQEQPAEERRQRPGMCRCELAQRRQHRLVLAVVSRRQAGIDTRAILSFF